MSKLQDLFTPTSRSRLKARPNGKPHWRPLATGRALGFRPHLEDPTSGTWSARWTVPGAKRHRETTLGEANGRVPADGETVLDFRQAVGAAQRWCEDQERAFNGLEPVDREPYTVGRAMADYLEWSRAHRKAPHQVEQVSRAHILPSLAEAEVAKLTPAQLRKWHARIASSPPLRRTAEGKERNVGTLDGPEDRRKRQSTANRALSVLKAALNMAYREGKVASDDPWRRVKPFKGVDRPKVRYLETDEAVRLLNACEPDFRRVVQGALLTGCRYGELCRLRMGDFKATPKPLIRLEDTKSGKGRYVFLSDEGAAFFGELTAGQPEGQPMFLRADGTAWGRSHQARRMLDASKTAKIDPPATFHELRHTYASHYLMNGGDLAGLAQQLGHADTRMTTRHYAHLADDWRADQARRHVPSFGAGGGRKADPGRLIAFSGADNSRSTSATR